MKAIVLVGHKKLEIQEIETPKPKENQVLLKVRACGICTNDVRDYIGENKYTLPRIGGHEYSGEIVDMGDSVDRKQFSIGQRAVAYILPACGECYYCRRGYQNLCEKVPTSKIFYSNNGFSGFGGFAQYICVDSKDLFILPNDISFEIATFCEPIACVLNSINRANIEIGDDVVVIGGGVMGLLHVLLAKMRGARVILSEPYEERRKIAESFGCDVTFNPNENDPIQFIKKMTNNRGADVVFNTTSISKVAEQAINMVGAAGKCIMFSSIHPNNPIQVDAGLLHSTERTITGAVSPTIYSYNQAVMLLSKKLIDPTKLNKLIYKIYDYTEAIDAFEAAARPETLKTIIKFD